MDCGDVVDDWVRSLPGPERRHQAARALATDRLESVDDLLAPLQLTESLDAALLSVARAEHGEPDDLDDLLRAGRFTFAERSRLSALADARADAPTTRVVWTHGYLDVERTTPLPVVRATIDGEPVRLILDTGSPMTVLGAHVGIGTSGEAERVQLDLGSVQVHDEIAEVVEITAAERRYADGRLGWSVLRHLRLRLLPIEGSVYVERPLPRAGSTLAHPFRPVVRACGPRGQRLDLHLTTGTADSTLHPSGASLLDVQVDEAGTPDIPLPVAYDVSMHLGETVVDLSIVPVTDDPGPRHHSAQGRLGWSVLAAAEEVILDGPGGVFTMEAPPP